METTILRVTPDDYNEEDVMRLFREGKLLIEVEQELPTREEVKAELLEYVSPLKDLCTPQYRENHEQIWLDIFHSDGFDLVMKKGARCGKLNKYRVMPLVIFLFNKGVYNSESPLKLYYKLEGTDKKGPVYTNASRDVYAVNDQQRPILKRLLQKYIR